MVARVVPVDPFDLVVFGATGDLARRKLIPALYHRMHDGQMPDTARVVGAARTEMESDGFRRIAETALDEFVGPAELDNDTKHRFLSSVDYVRLDAMSKRRLGSAQRRLARPAAAPARVLPLRRADLFRRDGGARVRGGGSRPRRPASSSRSRSGTTSPRRAG